MYTCFHEGIKSRGHAVLSRTDKTLLESNCYCSFGCCRETSRHGGHMHTLVLALKEVFTTATLSPYPFFCAVSRACSSVAPTKLTCTPHQCCRQCYKQAHQKSQLQQQHTCSSNTRAGACVCNHLAFKTCHCAIMDLSIFVLEVRWDHALRRCDMTYLRMGEASGRYSIVVQHMLTPTHVFNSTDALCTGSMSQHVFACNQAEAHVRAARWHLQSFLTQEHTSQDRLANDMQVILNCMLCVVQALQA